MSKAVWSVKPDQVAWYRIQFKCGCEILTCTTSEIVLDPKREWACPVHQMRDHAIFAPTSEVRGSEEDAWELLCASEDFYTYRKFPHEVPMTTKHPELR